jgi:hypothetical protein
VGVERELFFYWKRSGERAFFLLEKEWRESFLRNGTGAAADTAETARLLHVSVELFPSVLRANQHQNMPIAVVWLKHVSLRLLACKPSMASAGLLTPCLESSCWETRAESNFAALRLDKSSTGLFQQASGMAVLFCLVSPLLRIIIPQPIAILISISAPIWGSKTNADT